MPQSHSESPLSPRDIVREVYEAFTTADPETIERVARKHFADDVIVREAESLPWGGVYEGLETNAELSKGIASAESPIDAANLRVDQLHVTSTTSDGDTHVIAAVSFPWRGAVTIPMRALEWFTIRHGKVVEIQVFLWDTAAAISALQLPEASVDSASKV
ncbi:MAG: hypothetical protein EON54_05870 [Alcaligenaceae bacterium]|nr:MAG: hypothetical protein EON54_05870 [Alcaligenaceae bacterium]